ncbi:MAG: cysteine desulfurase-like protein [Pseudomonadota bacterium]
MPIDINAVRSQFPALALSDNNKQRIYLDGPAGTQVPQSVIDAVSAAFISANANLGGDFPTSIAAQSIVDGARSALADLLGTNDPETIILGPNMTGLTKEVSRSLGQMLSPGDTIVLSRMDHDANVSPWLDMADQHGLKVKWLDVDPETHMLSCSQLRDHLETGAKFVAVGYASNVLGTINPVQEICGIARQYGAISYIDAVHYAPHGLIDVADLGCDMLVCSVYKFFGPHCSGLYVRPDLLDELPAWPLRPAPKDGPVKFESGTMNHEGLAGSIAAVDYLASLGASQANTRRSQLKASFADIMAYEAQLCWSLIEGLSEIEGVKIHGITDRTKAQWRAPTISFTHARTAPKDIAAALTAQNIFSWAGHSYAIEPLGQLGLLEDGGVLRLGIAHYNTADEIEQTLNVLKTLLN